MNLHLRKSQIAPSATGFEPPQGGFAIGLQRIHSPAVLRERMMAIAEP